MLLHGVLSVRDGDYDRAHTYEHEHKEEYKEEYQEGYREENWEHEGQGQEEREGRESCGEYLRAHSATLTA